MIKKILILVAVSLAILSSVQANQEIITGLESKDLPVVNEELRKMRSDTRAVREEVDAVEAELDALITVPTGAILIWPASSLPTGGYLECDGSAISRTTYSGLFAVIGTTWGAGDGSTTFNLPDLRGRAPIGAGTGSGLTARTLAATGGAETHTLTESEMPSHQHTYQRFAGSVSVTSGGATSVQSTTLTGNGTSATGGGQAHNNMQPFAVTKFIIKT